MKSTFLVEIETALALYFAAIPRQKELNPPPLLPLIQSLGDLEKKYRAEMDPELRHFMQRQSYEKALAHIQNQ